ncbi:hypothetical protein CLPU_1c02290 [Gottschalkia purinilytica]|uniref:Uncharacterized protein n=1 Tax=Gottschalkia purinilytica TaxID=1503 RepID=A0A0L0WF12_GOTPU|nr:hypothetical protein [Gottschalkia purinilytica]KNF10064.1 hypothetical protein CLPU_1c02290 [Gottschalkia purinilytica]
MHLISTYRDLLGEIEIYQMRLNDLEREHYALERIKHTHKIDLERYIERNYRILNEMAVVKAVVEDKMQTKEEILDKLNQLEGLEYKIAYKKFIEGKNLNQISLELHISDSWAMKKSAEINKKMKKVKK